MSKPVPVRALLTLAVLAAAPAAASAAGDGRDGEAGLIRSDYRLPDADAADDAERWLLPDIAETYERREPPRLRWRGKKVKLRLPIG
jgi:hypothetical protein